MNNYITDDELNTFRSLSLKDKVDCMEAYLIGVNGRKMNMAEVGSYVFGNENYSYTVSLIHRCYNFSGQNGGKYRNGCQFEKNHGHRVNRLDIETFIRTYPNGTYDNGITFDQFLLLRVKGVGNAAPEIQNPYPRASRPAARVSRQTNANGGNYSRNQGGNYNRSQGSNRQGRGQRSNGADSPIVLTIMAVISIIILIGMLLSGNLFKHWMISLFLFLVAFGSVSSLKK